MYEKVGATLVRYQMHASWSQFTNAPDAVAAFNAQLDKWLDHLDAMLPWSRKYGIKICVDMHTHIGGATKEEYSSDMIFVEKKYEDVLVATWERIARRFKGNEDAIYGYDLFNEPIDRENNVGMMHQSGIFANSSMPPLPGWSSRTGSA